MEATYNQRIDSIKNRFLNKTFTASDGYRFIVTRIVVDQQLELDIFVDFLSPELTDDGLYAITRIGHMIKSYYNIGTSIYKESLQN